MNNNNNLFGFETEDNFMKANFEQFEKDAGFAGELVGSFGNITNMKQDPFSMGNIPIFPGDYFKQNTKE